MVQDRGLHCSAETAVTTLSSSNGTPSRIIETQRIIEMSSSSEYPADTADARISLAIEKDTEKAKSLPSAFSASAELAVIGPTLSDAHTDVDRRASKRQARELFSNAVPFGLWCGDSATEPLLVMCTSYVVYRDDRADWSDRVARTARESRKSLRYHGVSYGANIHHLLIVVQPVVDSIGKAHMAYNVRKQPLAQSLSDILCLYETARTRTQPVSIRATAVPRMWGRKCKRRTQHRMFHSMEMVGASVVLPLLYMLISPYLAPEGDAVYRMKFVDELHRLLEFCKARQSSSEPMSSEWQSIDDETSAIGRGMQALVDVAQHNALDHSGAADSCTTLQLRIAVYMRGAWPPDDRAERPVPYCTKRTHATLWDLRDVPEERRKYSSVTSSSVSGSSLSQYSTDFADGPGVSIRRLNTPDSSTEHVMCAEQICRAFKTLPLTDPVVHPLRDTRV